MSPELRFCEWMTGYLDGLGLMNPELMAQKELTKIVERLKQVGLPPVDPMPQEAWPAFGVGKSGEVLGPFTTVPYVPRFQSHG